MRRPFRGRMSLREKMQKNKAALDFMADMAEKDRLEFDIPPPPKKRGPRKPSDVPLEKEVLADVLQALRMDPRIALVERAQSGVFQDGDRHIRVGTPGKLDITLMLVGGRYGEIEVKRPGKKPDERQANRIEAIKRNGGIAGYATSAEEALALLP